MKKKEKQKIIANLCGRRVEIEAYLSQFPAEEVAVSRLMEDLAINDDEKGSWRKLLIPTILKKLDRERFTFISGRHGNPTRIEVLAEEDDDAKDTVGEAEEREVEKAQEEKEIAEEPVFSPPPFNTAEEPEDAEKQEPAEAEEEEDKTIIEEEEFEAELVGSLPDDEPTQSPQEFVEEYMAEATKREDAEREEDRNTFLDYVPDKDPNNTPFDYAHKILVRAYSDLKQTRLRLEKLKATVDLTESNVKQGLDHYVSMVAFSEARMNTYATECLSLKPELERTRELKAKRERKKEKAGV